MTQGDAPDQETASDENIDTTLRRHLELAQLEPKMFPRVIPEIEEALKLVHNSGEDSAARRIVLLLWLGDALLETPQGNREDNVERSITALEEALSLAQSRRHRMQRGRLLMTLASAYDQRIRGASAVERERALKLYQEAQTIFTREDHPVDWAMIQENMATLYEKRFIDGPTANQELALSCHEQALEILTRQAHPTAWGQIQANLGQLYMERLHGAPQENIDNAVKCYENALDVLEYQPSMRQYGGIQRLLGLAYARLAQDHGIGTIDHARQYLDHAVFIFDAEDYPHQHRELQLDIAHLEADREQWGAAHEAYALARQLESTLLRTVARPAERDRILQQGRDAAIRDAFALVRLQQLEQAALSVERGRTREYAEILAIREAPIDTVTDPGQRARLEEARRELDDRQRELYEPVPRDLGEQMERDYIKQRTTSYQQARDRFECEVREHESLVGFMEQRVERADILQAAKRGGERHALVYLFATPWGGSALASFNVREGGTREADFRSLELPDLTDDFVRDLIQTHLDKESGRVVGGFGHAQEYHASSVLLNTLWWPGESLSAQMEELRTACLAQHKSNTLLDATQRVLATVQANPETASLASKPSAQLSPQEKQRLDGTFAYFFLQAEIHRCLPRLSSVAMAPLVSWLRHQGAASFTLIPCGALAAFPLGAAPISPEHTVADVLPYSVAPSARSLLRIPTDSVRSGLYAIGDTRPESAASGLPDTKREAEGVAALAHHARLPAQHAIHDQGTKKWILKGLATGQVVHAACHGSFDSRDFLRSALLLAHNEQISLADLLRGTVALDGLRLCILSACQTSVLDLRGATDEVRSLAAGVLHAGAQAVIASLWPVDDRATYLLMTRFSYEWLPRIRYEAPASALARAQQWLRTATTAELLRWEDRLEWMTARYTRQVEREVPAGRASEKRWHVRVWQLFTRMPSQVSSGTRSLDSSSVSRQTPGSQDASREGDPRLCRVRGGEERYTESTLRGRHPKRESAGERHTQPYADPINWAGFQVTGW